MAGALNVLGKLIRHGQVLLIYPSAFESREERLANYDFPSDLPYEDVNIVTSDRKTLKCILLRASRRSRLSTDSRRASSTALGSTRYNHYVSWKWSLGVTFFWYLIGAMVILTARPRKKVTKIDNTCSITLLRWIVRLTGLQRDSQAALDFVLGQAELSKSPIVLHGHSLGGAVAIDLTQRNPEKVHGLIVENTFLSIPAIVKDIPGLRHLAIFIHQKWESYRRIERIPRTIPILMFSGTEDEVVPAKQMQELWSIAQRRNAKGVEQKGKSGWKSFVFGSSRDCDVSTQDEGEEDGKDSSMDVFKSIPGGTHGKRSLLLRASIA
uniref:Serine aminopeptidase S33 domain-containing protein n=1 Tax=Moniliophthora roreri TaxID=221103 RepID=A0A0W0G9M5_MONRR